MNKDQDAVEPETVAEDTAATAQEEAVDSTEGKPEDLGSEDLHLMLEDARAKADEHWEQVIRAQAELDNLRKRHERELENAHKFALERFSSELLQVRDSLELGLSAAREENADVAKLLEGTELTLKLLADLMVKFNISQLDPQGQPFDPEYHQAMTMQPRDDVPPNTVVTVVQKGYTLNGRLIRPAMVIVSQGGDANRGEQA